MINNKIESITRRLILAKKRLDNIQSTKFELKTAIPEEIKRLGIVEEMFEKARINPLPSFTPASPILMDLGKLNGLLSDKNVLAVECQGAGKNLKVRKEQILETSVQLNESEIQDILNKFSRASGIQISPLMKAAYGNLMINVFISPALGTKFLITKKIL
jgi:hypothetical protein